MSFFQDRGATHDSMRDYITCNINTTVGDECRTKNTRNRTINTHDMGCKLVSSVAAISIVYHKYKMSDAESSMQY